MNGAKVQQHALRDGDLITFGIDGSYQIVFHAAVAGARPRPHESVANLLTRIGTLSDFTGTGTSGGLSKLNLLLEATSLLHSQLPLDSVLGTMLDHAISITHADRGLLIEPDATGALHVHLARSNKGENLPPETLNPSQTAIHQAISRQSSVITEDLNLAGLDLKAAESIVVQGLRAVVAIPLYASSRSTADTGAEHERGQLLGVDLSRFTAHRGVLGAGPADSGRAWRCRRPAFWTTRGWWSGNASASGSSRSFRSRAPSSRRCCRTDCTTSLTWP